MLNTPQPVWLVLMLASATPSMAADAKIRTRVSESQTIFVAEIQDVLRQGDCSFFLQGTIGSKCDTRVRVRIAQVIKVEDRAQIPMEFDCEIHQVLGRSVNASRWSSPIQVGQRYLIFSLSKQSVPDIFASTLAPILVTDNEDIVSDVEMILHSELLTLTARGATPRISAPARMAAGAFVGVV
jgi:hypothetical protein